ncbi:hypothetical protein [Ancylobacter oerskovii]|nr:hypothetical protein [Ancylobacter oerskovii]MBS7542950.1 hypothetical protein [Ancylobacter oerskovii]
MNITPRRSPPMLRKRTVIMRFDCARVPDMARRSPFGGGADIRFRCHQCGHVSGRAFGLTPSAIARGVPCPICNG